MKAKEELVYNKHLGKIIGFTSLGDINDELLRIENEDRPKVAKHVLVLMVRGILFKMNFPYAHFGTRYFVSHSLESHSPFRSDEFESYFVLQQMCG